MLSSPIIDEKDFIGFLTFLFEQNQNPNTKITKSKPWKPTWSNGLTKGSLIFLYYEVWDSSPIEGEICELIEKRRTKDLEHGVRNTVEHRSYRVVQVMYHM